LIQRALDDTLTDYDIIARDVLEGRALLWLVWDGTEIYAAIVTSLGVSNGRKFCTIVACGGRAMLHWLCLIERIEAYARREGCRSIAVMGRTGWQRKLRDYKLKSVTIEKELA
jgi:hypothetical protein